MRFQHPHIDPPLVIEVDEDVADDHVEAGWLPHEGDAPTGDPSPGPDSPEENPA